MGRGAGALGPRTHRRRRQLLQAPVQDALSPCGSPALQGAPGEETGPLTRASRYAVRLWVKRGCWAAGGAAGIRGVPRGLPLWSPGLRDTPPRPSRTSLRAEETTPASPTMHLVSCGSARRPTPLFRHKPRPPRTAAGSPLRPWSRGLQVVVVFALVVVQVDGAQRRRRLEEGPLGQRRPPRAQPVLHRAELRLVPAGSGR